MAEAPHALIREEIKEKHIESHAPYGKVFCGLLILTVIEFFYARIFKDYFLLLILGLLGWAIVKAAMVGWYFMHLKFEGKWVYLLLIPAGLLAALLVLALIPDIAMKPTTDDNLIPDDEAAVSSPAERFERVWPGGFSPEGRTRNTSTQV